MLLCVWLGLGKSFAALKEQSELVCLLVSYAASLNYLIFLF